MMAGQTGDVNCACPIKNCIEWVTASRAQAIKRTSNAEQGPSNMWCANGAWGMEAEAGTGLSDVVRWYKHLLKFRPSSISMCWHLAELSRDAFFQTAHRFSFPFETEATIPCRCNTCRN